jgi:indolepyruvate ferredoxin oxidoreductase
VDVEALKAAIRERAGDSPVVFVDAKRIAEAVFSDHLLANVILVGAAFQLGGLPVSPDDAERAIAGQGRAAAANGAAFTWGRWAAHDPLDVFGWDRDRRLERALIGEFERLVLDSAGLPYDLQARLAESVLSVKGYAAVKEATVDRWRETVASLRAQARAAGPRESQTART